MGSLQLHVLPLLLSLLLLLGSAARLVWCTTTSPSWQQGHDCCGGWQREYCCSITVAGTATSAFARAHFKQM
jgi:hypothetical protein